jgi:hypothetical protein
MRQLRSVLVCSLLAFVTFSLPANAGTSQDGSDAGDKRGRIAELRAQAGQLRTEARTTFDAASRQCAGSFTNNCMDAAWAARKRTESAAHQRDKQALELAKEIKAETRKTKQAMQEERAKYRSTPEARAQARAQIRQEKEAVRREKQKWAAGGFKNPSPEKGME